MAGVIYFIYFAASRNEFYLAPEYQEHGIVTEKVRVYEPFKYISMFNHPTQNSAGTLH